MTETFKERVNKRLEFLDLSPSGASAKAGLDRETLPKLLRSDHSEPHPRTTRKLAAALKTNSKWLLYGDGNENAVESVDKTDPDHSLFTETEIRSAIESLVDAPAIRGEPPTVIAGLVISIMIERRRMKRQSGTVNQDD